MTTMFRNRCSGISVVCATLRFWEKAFLDHIVEKHSGGADDGRVLIEYRKKVIGLVTHLGPSDACPRF